MEVETLYKNRFSQKEIVNKDRLWRNVCKHFLSKYVKKEDCVLDLAAGYCEFINNIEASKKIAVDINPDTIQFASKNVQVIIAIATDMAAISSGSIDVIFISNFFEHISKEEILLVLRECNRILAPGGRILILQPNIKYIGSAYWDFFDHHTPLTDKSLREALEMSGYKIKTIIPKFLPYTTKSKIPQYIWLVIVYLHFPLAWKIMGKQLFAVAEKI
ncbi:methyltransferase domain-containing protein [Parabacteroides bouchesdurhonensis]|uniref:methyltransferase domain-containing protein n=1 Tax=Parabacteroides bouchesdurhonensis TaxID=1936995 RepID=UPI000E4AA49F|nr:class I SAM-dependent methyltransferase [Parabacteroides bouchesdurhonensis]RHJ94174.1 class I SAM-dependent methyltransferase [Bacteroides sp. AM07-16]